MTKTREISSERQKQEKYHWNDKNKKVIGTVKTRKMSLERQNNNIILNECDAFVILNVSEGSFVANAPSE